MVNEKMKILDNAEFQDLYEKSKNLIDSARSSMGQMANTITVLTSFYWEGILLSRSNRELKGQNMGQKF